MQRALFLIESTGERISALLNPERLEIARRSGVEALAHGSGSATGVAMSDNLLLATGGGTTELVLDLLFDVDLAETGRPAATQTVVDGTAGLSQAGVTAPLSDLPVADVRELTRPLWNLSESVVAGNRRARLPIVRFIWGRSWNLPGVVTDVAERFERFDQEGRPRRSFIRLKLRRVAEPDAAPAADFTSGQQPSSVTPFYEFPSSARSIGAEAAERVDLPLYETGMPSVPLYQLAASALGDPTQWRSIALFNDIDDPFHLQPGTLIALPVAAGGERR